MDLILVKYVMFLAFICLFPATASIKQPLSQNTRVISSRLQCDLYFCSALLLIMRTSKLLILSSSGRCMWSSADDNLRLLIWDALPTQCAFLLIALQQDILTITQCFCFQNKTLWLHGVLENHLNCAGTVTHDTNHGCGVGYSIWYAWI